MPDQVVNTAGMGIESIVVRMDFLFNEQNLVQQLAMCPCSIVTDKPISTEIIKKYKLPFVPVKSKSGGLHIFVFFNDFTSTDKVLKKLNEINQQYFLAQEIFPCNKAVNMPYHNVNASMEFAFDDNNTPVLVGKFIEIAYEKMIAAEDFYNFKVQEYEAESQWKDYPPCVQKLIQEGWSGNNRNNFLFNVLVLESKKDASLSVQQLEQIALARNNQIFSQQLSSNEVIALAK